MDTAIKELHARLEEIDANRLHLHRSAQLRGRIGGILNWDAKGEVLELAKAFMANKSSRPEDILGGMHVQLMAAFERFLRRSLQTTVAAIYTNASSYEAIPERLRIKNIAATGRAIASSESGREHLRYDLIALTKALHDCLAPGPGKTLNDVVFADMVGSPSAGAIEEIDKLLELGLGENWDSLGASSDLESVLGTTGPRETARETRAHLIRLCRIRNVAAHAGDGEATVLDSDLSQSIQFVRALSGALTTTLDARIAELR